MDEDSICSKTGKIHEPDLNSVHIEHDGSEVYIDVNCKDCGASGCIGTLSGLKEEISW